MTEEDIQILKGISLVDVLRENGHEPYHLPKKGKATYYCPFPDHSERTPSFKVDQTIEGGADSLGWMCYGKCGRRGYGAISLQAALLGYDHTALTKKQLGEVLQRLVDDHGIEISGVTPTAPEQHTKAIRPQECDPSNLAPWTEQHLRALGFKVELAKRKAELSDVEKAKQAMEDADAPANRAEVQIGDMVTEFNPDNGLPLYRCSLDRNYWRGRGEAKTAQEWGEVLEREFSIYPVETFITGPVEAKQGGQCSLEVHARPSYPIFVMTYDWGVKKYEPKASGRTKWYWSKTEGISAKVYGDSVALAALKQMAVCGKTADNTTDERPWHADWKKDRRHPIVELTKEVNKEKVTSYKMKRLVLCSGPRDAMQMWSATDAHVLWLNSETAGIRDGVVEEWLRALLFRMQEVAINIYVCYDLDATGISSSSSIALENANVHWVRLPREMGNVVIGKSDDRAKAAKDVTDFVIHFSQIQKLLSPDLRKANPSAALMRMLDNAMTMQFWIDKATTKKTRDGESKETNVRYVLSVANLLQFLEAKGIRCYVDSRGQRSFYQLSHKNTYRLLDTGRTGNQLESVSRTAMLDWIDAHISEADAPYKANLVNAVFTGKGLDGRTLSTMPSLPVKDHSYGEDFDYFFFENTAVLVTKERITAVDYTSMPYQTNEECIMPGDFKVIDQPWRIIINPKYDAEKKRHEDISRQCSTPAMHAAENTRWKEWEQLWKYRLIMDKPLEQMPMHFRFLYNQGRIFWEKESFGETLTATERQMQDMHFVNKVHAFGYVLTRHRSRAVQRAVHITDYSVTDENKASGRNGKSADIDMLASVRPSSANIAGKSMKNITIEVMMGNVVVGVHSLVCIDELPENFKVEDMFNTGTTIVCKTLYKQPVTLRGEDVPKIFIASNKPFDRSGGSVKGRIYPCFTSDYYHAATDDGRWLDFTPADEFMEQYGVQEVANGLPAHLLNEERNLMVACAQFYLQHPGEVILPPTETRSLRRELYAMTKDGALTDWLVQYFEDTPDNPHIGQPIAPQEMAISLLDSEGESVNYDTIEKAKKRIAKSLKPCLNRMGIVMDPDVVLNSASYRRRGARQSRAWQTVLDAGGKPIERTTKDRYRREVSTGERLPRELSPHAVFVHYFYRNRPGGIPVNPYTVGKEYEEGYVQAAAKEDPEGVKNEE
ncbi:MAG: hypothetical protein J6M41_09115 [Prevotella sp.]|nr:hypothetical protein [Prevotella sp.]